MHQIEKTWKNVFGASKKLKGIKTFMNGLINHDHLLNIGIRVLNDYLLNMISMIIFGFQIDSTRFFFKSFYFKDVIKID